MGKMFIVFIPDREAIDMLCISMLSGFQYYVNMKQVR